MSFQSFMTQYQSQSREKLNGYAASDFSGMTVEELAAAEKILTQDAYDLDTTAFQGLSLINSASSRAVLREILGNLKPPSMAHLRCAEFLFDMTQDTDLQPVIFTNADTREKLLWEQTVIALARTPPSRFQFEKMKAIVIGSKQQSLAKSSAGEALIRCFGFPEFVKDQNQERLAVERAIFQSTPQTFDAAVLEVRKLAEKRAYPRASFLNEQSPPESSAGRLC